MPSTKILKRCGSRIRDLRKQKNLTQEKLAEKVKLRYTYIGTVERGEKNISLINIEKISKALRVSLAKFFSSFK